MSTTLDLDALYDQYVDSGAIKNESWDEFLENYAGYVESVGQ